MIVRTVVIKYYDCFGELFHNRLIYFIIDIVEESNNQVVDTKYYNLNGTEIPEPEKGLYIIKVLYSNGKTEIRKICR